MKNELKHVCGNEVKLARGIEVPLQLLATGREGRRNEIDVSANDVRQAWRVHQARRNAAK